MTSVMEIKLFAITYERLYFLELFINIVIFSVSSNLGDYAKAIEHPLNSFYFSFICLLWFFFANIVLPCVCCHTLLS